MPTAELIAARLYEAAEGRAKMRGYRFGDGSESDMKSLAGRAAQTLNESSEAPSNAVLRAAEVAFERLVDGMIEASEQISGYRKAHPGVIGERTLARAMKQLCPLWPIC